MYVHGKGMARSAATTKPQKSLFIKRNPEITDVRSFYHGVREAKSKRKKEDRVKPILMQNISKKERSVCVCVCVCECMRYVFAGGKEKGVGCNYVKATDVST